ncbi:MAG: YdbL family protein [Altererythrobacter sp.]
MRSAIAKKTILAAAAAALAFGGVAGAAWAQRDPAYAAARAGGQVGEKMDGYLGIVGTSSAELQRMVSDINIKRKAVYAERAQAKGATIEEYAFTAGCEAISRTVAGEKYQAPDGSWKTRTSAPPDRDVRCP